MPLPSATAPWLSPDAVETAARILASHRQAFGRPLIAAGHGGPAPELFASSTVVLAHDGGPDPRLIYANAAALRLWHRPWASMVGLPSRLTAEPAERRDRAHLLRQALQRNAVRGYSGIRVDSQGRRFRIHGARLWTLHDAAGQACGQAAAFDAWWWL